MKKLLVNTVLATIVLLFSFLNVLAQQKNNFRGTIIMEFETNGRPSSSTEIKVYDNQIYVPNEMGSTIIFGSKQYYLYDLSEINILMEIGGKGLEGSGLMYIEDTFSIDNVLKDGKTKIKYLPGTKKIEGFDTKKAIITLEDEQGNKSEAEVWYTEKIGPEYSTLIISAVKGFPLEATIKTDTDITTIRIKEIKQGGVGEADFFIPAKYKKVTQEEFMKAMEAIQKVFGS